ncbi:MAG: DUF2815 family protein [Chromatiaceae bacterium]|nr:DUF2815 family protein [Chromatiaceae bacterium]
MEIILKNVRMAFPTIWIPQAINDGEPSFGANFIVPPESDNAKLLAATIKKVAAEKWKDKTDAVLAKLKQDGRICYHTNPMTNSAGEVYSGFEGMYWVRTGNKMRPMIVDRNPNVPLTPADGRPYGGCFVNAKIDLWAQDNKWGKRVNASLLVIQYVGPGEAFSGGAAPSIAGLEDLGEAAGAPFDADDLF